jgi:hypothetical protein
MMGAWNNKHWTAGADITINGDSRTVKRPMALLAAMRIKVLSNFGGAVAEQ